MGTVSIFSTYALEVREIAESERDGSQLRYSVENRPCCFQ